MARPKTHYNENEAAEALGVSVEQLRSLIRLHLAIEESELSQGGAPEFQASDLLVLRLLNQQRTLIPS